VGFAGNYVGVGRAALRRPVRRGPAVEQPEKVCLESGLERARRCDRVKRDQRSSRPEDENVLVSAGRRPVGRRHCAPTHAVDREAGRGLDGGSLEMRFATWHGCVTVAPETRLGARTRQHRKLVLGSGFAREHEDDRRHPFGRGRSRG